jgi:putative tricarboxylic transport membrane protein
MKAADRISAAFWIAFALVAIEQSYRLGLGSLRQPGPGFLFFWTGILLVALSLVILIKTFAHNGEEQTEKPIFAGVNYTKIILVSVAIFLYALLLDFLGFILVTFLLFAFILAVAERKRWFFAICSSLIVAIGSYLVFETWLETQLPKGLLGFLRF